MFFSHLAFTFQSKLKLEQKQCCSFFLSLWLSLQPHHLQSHFLLISSLQQPLHSLSLMPPALFGHSLFFKISSLYLPSFPLFFYFIHHSPLIFPSILKVPQGPQSPTDCPLSWECGLLSPLTSSSSCLAGDRVRWC